MSCRVLMILSGALSVVLSSFQVGFFHFVSETVGSCCVVRIYMKSWIEERSDDFGIFVVGVRIPINETMKF